MFSTELPSDLNQLIEDFIPGFEENLIRAFKNEAVREQKINNNTNYIHKIDNILFSQDDTKIELRNLKFPWIPDFRITKLSIDLSMLCLNVVFRLGDLRIDGDYEATNMNLQRLLPISNNGKIAIVFREVTTSGRIGLLIKGDALVPVNYDIKYEPTETSISVKYFVSSENEVENNIIRARGDDVIGDTLWLQLNGILTNLLHRQLAQAMVHFSLMELFGEAHEQLRYIARDRSSKANRLVDSLLCVAKDYIVDKQLRSIETPPFNVVYRGKLTGVFQGRLHTGMGYLQDLATLCRLEDLSLHEDQQRLIVYGSLNLREMKHGYDHFRSQFEDTQVNGGIKTTIYFNRISIKIIIFKESYLYNSQVESLKFSNIGDIDVDASGLASLSWLVPKLDAWVVGNLRYSALPVLEKHIKEAFDYAIAKTDCVGLNR